MEALTYSCLCGHSLSVKEKQEGMKCPSCGKPIGDASQEKNHPKNLSDAMIEATYEIMAEEGAIWSGAR